MTIDWPLYHWHLEVSGKCTLQCPRCPRTEMPNTPWINKELDLAFIQRLFAPDLLRSHVKRITMCGDVGDPIYASEFLDIIKYLKSTSPDLHIFVITNGSHRKPGWWSSLAGLLNHRDTINFSIDGFDHNTNILYRRGSDWDSIMQGMSIMCTRSDAFVNWASIVFRFNQDHLDGIMQQAHHIGCDGMQFTHSTKFGSKYGGAYQGFEDPLEPRAEFVSDTHRYHRIYHKLSARHQDTTDYININEQKFLNIKKRYQDQDIVPMCEIGNRGMYVSADGVLHPCSWVSFPYHSMSNGNKTIHWKDSFHQRYRDRLSLHTRNLDTVLQDPLWQKLTSSWHQAQRTWVECSQKCSTQLVNREYAVQWLTN